MPLTPRPLYSWQDDPTVPDFDDTRTLVVMDGDCALCSFGARVLARFDRQDQIRIATAGSPLGRALLHHYGIDPEDPESWLTLSDGQGQGALDGIIATYAPLHWIFWPLRSLTLLPRGARNWIYARIARNRIALFGRADMCAIPDPALRRRLLDYP